MEKLKYRTIRLSSADNDPRMADSAARLLRNVKGITRVEVSSPDRIRVSYNVRRITMQIIEALLTEFGYRLHMGLFCSLIRNLCYYIEDIECTDPVHGQAENTRDAFIMRYLRRPHGCRDHRPEYLRRYL